MLSAPSPNGAVSGVLALLLIALLAGREILRAYAGDRRTRRLEVLNVAIAPLLVAFVVVVMLRVTGHD